MEFGRGGFADTLPMLMIRPPCGGLCLHLLDRRAPHQEDRGHVGVHHVYPVVKAHLVDRLAGGDSGVVDHDVDPAMCLHDLGEQRVHIGFLGHIGGRAPTPAAPPLPRISATMPSSTSLRRATSTVLAPSAAKFSAMALPMPELAPVTMATRS